MTAMFNRPRYGSRSGSKQGASSLGAATSPLRRRVSVQNIGPEGHSPLGQAAQIMLRLAPRPRRGVASRPRRGRRAAHHIESSEQHRDRSRRRPPRLNAT